MGFSRDEHPWVGTVPENNNLYIAAGYTGHGMPNTWLSGKFVARLVQKTLTAGGDAASGVLNAVADEVGLPKSYLVTKERVAKAMEMQDVEALDWAEMERGRRRMEVDRPHSGYA